MVYFTNEIIRTAGGNNGAPAIPSAVSGCYLTWHTETNLGKSGAFPPSEWQQLVRPMRDGGPSGGSWSSEGGAKGKASALAEAKGPMA